MASQFKHPGLESMGYRFNDDLELRQIENGEGFKWQGQQHYDVLGDEVTEWIQDYMVSHYGMKEIWLGDAYPEGDESDSEEGSVSTEKKGEGEEEKKEKEEPLVWEKASRSGVFTVQAENLGRVTSSEMKKHAKVNIFISPDFYEAEKLLILVQGSGAVRPGQWARALCINQSLKAGTIFDYLDIARECGMATIVLNPNQDRLRLRVKSEEHPLGVFDSKHSYPIRGHEDHIKHILRVYDDFILKAPAKNMWMVAHSRGGDSALQLLNHRLGTSLIDAKRPRSTSSSHNRSASSTGDARIESKVSTISVDDQDDEADLTSDLERRLRALAFTDSVHWIGSSASSQVNEWLDENARDWVASKHPLDTPEPSHKDTAGCDCYSAGHAKHEWTSPCAVNSVFKFFDSHFATIGSFPSWRERQIPFSTPPQNMPETKPEVDTETAEGAKLERSTSYADVARKSIKLDESPIVSSSTATAASVSTETEATPATPVLQSTIQPPVLEVPPSTSPDAPSISEPTSSSSQSQFYRSREEIQIEEDEDEPLPSAHPPAVPEAVVPPVADEPDVPIAEEPAVVAEEPIAPSNAIELNPRYANLGDDVPVRPTPTPDATPSSSSSLLSSNAAFLVGFATVAACALGAVFVILRRSKAVRK